MSNILIVVKPSYAAALIAYLEIEMLISGGNYEVKEHVTIEDVKDKDVWGALPHSLSCYANSFVEVPFKLPMELRGKVLTCEELFPYIGDLNKYKIKHTELLHSRNYAQRLQALLHPARAIKFIDNSGFNPNTPHGGKGVITESKSAEWLLNKINCEEGCFDWTCEIPVSSTEGQFMFILTVLSVDGELSYGFTSFSTTYQKVIAILNKALN